MGWSNQIPNPLVVGGVGTSGEIDVYDASGALILTMGATGIVIQDAGVTHKIRISPAGVVNGLPDIEFVSPNTPAGDAASVVADDAGASATAVILSSTAYANTVTGLTNRSVMQVAPNNTYLASRRTDAGFLYGGGYASAKDAAGEIGYATAGTAITAVSCGATQTAVTGPMTVGGTLTSSGTLTASGALAVTGASTMTGAVKDANGKQFLPSNLGLTSGTLTASQNITTATYSNITGLATFSFTKMLASTRLLILVIGGGWSQVGTGYQIIYGVNLNSSDTDVGRYNFNTTSDHRAFSGMAIRSGDAAGTYTVTGRVKISGGANTATIDSGDSWAILVMEIA